MQKPGFYQGRHYTTYPDEVRELKRANRLEAAKNLLLHLIDAVESESRAKRWGVAPWYYEQLAIVYRKQGDRVGEQAILERFVRQEHASGATPEKLLRRLRRLTDDIGEDTKRPSSELTVTPRAIASEEKGHENSYRQEVVGESNYQPALRRVRDTLGREFIASLEAEPDNPYDADAVVVRGPSGDVLGYLPRSIARRSREIIAAAERMEVKAKLIGGTREKANIGVLLKFRPPEARPTQRAATATHRAVRDDVDKPRPRQGSGCLTAILILLAALLGFCS